MRLTFFSNRGAPLVIWAICLAALTAPALSEDPYHGAIVSALDSKNCVTAPGNEDTQGQRLQLQLFVGSGEQVWDVTPERMLRNQRSGLCIDATDGSDHVALIQSACAPGTSSQLWTWTSKGALKPDVAPKMCMVVLSGVLLPGMVVALKPCKRGREQEWLKKPAPRASLPRAPLSPPPPIPSLSPPPVPPAPPLEPQPLWLSEWRAQHASVWNKCPKQSCLVIVGVMSGMHFFEQRQMLRNTYMQNDWRAEGVTYLFIIAKPRFEHNHTQAQLEFDTYQDMLFLDNQECDASGERHCHIKSMYYIEWIAKTAGVDKSTFWVKTDMDTLVNPFALKLQALQLPHMRVFYGRWNGIFSDDTRGDGSAYFGGPFYMFSGDVAVWMATNPGDDAKSPADRMHSTFWTKNRPEDMTTSQRVAQYIPKAQWFPALQCEIHEPIDRPDWCFWRYRLNVHSVAVHCLKTKELWDEHFALMQPFVETWRGACEPKHDGVELMDFGDWMSKACFALAPAWTACDKKRCAFGIKRVCPADLDAEYHESLRTCLV